MQQKNNFRIFCDMDQTLADFEEAFYRLTGQWSYPLREKMIKNFMQEGFDEATAICKWETYFWNIVDNTPKFWETIPPVPGFSKIRDTIFKFNPIILTAVPCYQNSRRKAIQGKRVWINEHLGDHIAMFTVNQDKINHLQPQKTVFCEDKNDILIDDSVFNIESWKQKGGKVILHINAKKTVKEFNIIIKEVLKNKSQ